MNLLKLPLWDLFEKDFHSNYHYLTFDLLDYWYYVFVFFVSVPFMLFTIWVIFIIPAYTKRIEVQGHVLQKQGSVIYVWVDWPEEKKFSRMETVYVTGEEYERYSVGDPISITVKIPWGNGGTMRPRLKK